MNPFDEHFDDALAADSAFGEPDTERCRKCGADGLHWEMRVHTQTGKEFWRLYEADVTQHKCRDQASVNEFEAV